MRTKCKSRNVLCCVRSFRASYAYFRQETNAERISPDLQTTTCTEVYETGLITKSFISVLRSTCVEFSGARNGHQCFCWIDAGPTRKAYSSSVWCEKMLWYCFVSYHIANTGFSFWISGYEEVRSWLLRKAGKEATHLQIANFVGEANLIVANMRTAVSGFRRTGIWPLDGNVFLEVDILPAATTDIAPKRFRLAPCEETTSSAVWQRKGVSRFSNVESSK
jgi:hypothetical protein